MSLYRRVYRIAWRERLTALLVFAATFAAAAVIVMAVILSNAHLAVRGEVARQAEALGQRSDNVMATFGELQARSAQAPCSPAFLEWMRHVAFLPDGVHEILHAGDAGIQCSVSQGVLEQPIDLGPPDIARPGADIALWVDRDLSVIDLPGMRGTFMRHGDFLVIAPDPEYAGTPPSWMSYEFVIPGDNGEWWTRLGTPGLYEHWRGRLADAVPPFTATACGPLGLDCLVATVNWPRYWQAVTGATVMGLAVAVAFALAITFAARSRIKGLWSLPVRFARNFTPETLVCHYQPLLDLRRDAVDGVEVLVRWRDLDGRIRFPDAFLPVVEARGMTRRLTAMVAQKSFQELSALEQGLPRSGKRPLQVNFNIYPRDFDPVFLREVFQPFLSQPDRFSVVVELVETDELSIETTRAIIEELHLAGIRTFIDDFGVGYSSINYLAGLGADGVKLDRVFAMAPDGTLMSTMLKSVIEMISNTGLHLVIEGVETEQRLQALRASNKVDTIQGYHVSRPLSLPALNQFLNEHAMNPAAGGDGSVHQFTRKRVR